MLNVPNSILVNDNIFIGHKGFFLHENNDALHFEQDGITLLTVGKGGVTSTFSGGVTVLNSYLNVSVNTMPIVSIESADTLDVNIASQLNDLTVDITNSLLNVNIDSQSIPLSITPTGTLDVNVTNSAINATILNTMVSVVNASIPVSILNTMVSFANTVINATVLNTMVSFDNTVINATILNTMVSVANTLSIPVSFDNTAINATVSNTAFNVTVLNPTSTYSINPVTGSIFYIEPTGGVTFPNGASIYTTSSNDFLLTSNMVRYIGNGITPIATSAGTVDAGVQRNVLTNNYESTCNTQLMKVNGTTIATSTGSIDAGTIRIVPASESVITSVISGIPNVNITRLNSYFFNVPTRYTGLGMMPCFLPNDFYSSVSTKKFTENGWYLHRVPMQISNPGPLNNLVYDAGSAYEASLSFIAGTNGIYISKVRTVLTVSGGTLSSVGWGTGNTELANNPGITIRYKKSSTDTAVYLVPASTPGDSASSIMSNFDFIRYNDEYSFVDVGAGNGFFTFTTDYSSSGCINITDGEYIWGFGINNYVSTGQVNGLYVDVWYYSEVPNE